MKANGYFDPAGGVTYEIADDWESIRQALKLKHSRYVEKGLRKTRTIRDKSASL